MEDDIKTTKNVAITVTNIQQDKRKAVIRDWIRYSIVGTSSAAIELVLFFVFYNLLGVYVVASNIVAIALAATYNFTMSRKWTFKSVSNLTRSLLLYIALTAWNQLFSSWAIVGLIAFGLHTMVAKVLTMLCIVSWNFVLYRRVVFR